METKDFRYFNVMFNGSFTNNRMYLNGIYINNMTAEVRKIISDILADYEFKFTQERKTFDSFKFTFNLLDKKLLFVTRNRKNSSMLVEYLNEDYLKQYESDDEDMYLNLDKVKTQIHELDKVYVFNNITIAYTYYTKNDHRHIVTNSNMIGYPELLKKRAYKLRKIVNSI